MVRGIHCHSAFKHYEMFHSPHGGDNWGSIFNTTYNINANGGGGGNFWSGFGFGLGNAISGLFGNFMGGGMFGGGMPMMGGMFGGMPMMGGMFGGFPWMGGLSGLWNGNNNHGKTNNDGKCHCHDKDSDNEVTSKKNKDLDEAKMQEIREQLDKWKKDDAKIPFKEAKKAHDEIKELIDKKGLDSENTRQATEGYSNLLEDLEDLVPRLKTGKEKPSREAGNSGEANKPGETGNAGEANKPGETGDAGEANKPGEAENKDKVKNAIEEAKKLSGNQLQEYLNKLEPSVRQKVKASFYKKGYKNVKKAELTPNLINNLKTIIDKSEIADFNNIKKITDIKQNNNIITFKMTSNSGTVVCYAEVREEDGEIIFHGKNTNQEYVLQKDSEGNLHLMQYEYHNGYGTADVTSK